MRTTEERVKSVMQKTAEKRKTLNRRRQLLTRGVAYSSCILVICILGNRLSVSKDLLKTIDGWDAHTASIVTEGNTLELVIMGTVAFVLGVLTEILMSKVNKKYEKRDRDEKEE